MIRRAAAWLGLTILVVVLVNYSADRAQVSWDLTAERSASLSDSTREVLDSLDDPVRITAFFQRDTPGRVEAVTLLSRYRRVNRRVSFRVVDPVLAPGEAQALGAGLGEAAVESLDADRRIETIPFVNEIGLTSAIARLIRDVEASVCFSADGRAVTDDGPGGVSTVAGLLDANGYEIRTVSLLADGEPLRGCDAVVVAGPSSDAGAERLVGHLREGGRLLLLTDPESDAGLGLLEAWGISFARGFVLEADPGSRLPGDLLSPIVHDYSGSNPAVRGLGATFFPGVQQVVVEEPDRPSLVAYPVARTSASSYLERNLGDGTIDPDDVAGPIDVGAAADDSEVVSGEVRRTRVMVFGDSDFASNAFVGEASNAQLVIRSMDWITETDSIATAVPNFPKVRELQLTVARSRAILYATAVVVPGFFLLVGALVWAVGRGR